jgi:hypothetical protein
MAEERLQIVIEAVDNISRQLDTITSNLDKVGKSAIVTQQSISSSSVSSITSLVALGNAAASVDRIFSSYQNIQLRLENAAERVANAQDRLTDAQYKLKKVQSDSTTTAEDLAKAENDVERASRALTISQNNQERANNMVIGTYINLGIQSLMLLQALPKLVETIVWLTRVENLAKLGDEAWTAAKVILLALTNPLILALGLAAAAAGLYALNSMQATKATTEFSNSLTVVTKAQNELNKSNDTWFGFFEQEPNIIDYFNLAADAANSYANAIDRAKKIELLDIVGGGINTAESVTATKTVYHNPGGGYDPKKTTVDANGTVHKYADFISRPGQGVSSFSSDDTIIGVKNPNALGMTIIINGDNYGINADDIARKLFDKLRRKITV